MRPLVLLCLLLASVVAVPTRRKTALPWDLDAPYQDKLPRTKLYPMSAAAYADDPRPCVKNTFGDDAEVIGSTTAKCDFVGDSCFAFTVASHVDQAIILSFRGTENSNELNQIMDQINFEHEKFVGGGKCGQWFINTFNALWNAGVKDNFLTARNKYPGYQVWVTGHNSGGSLASIASAYLVYTKMVSSDDLLLMTMGQPRTGDKDYADVHDKLVKHSYRIVHNRDESAHLPVKNWENYYHHGAEVWYPNMMKEDARYTVCPEGESDKCSDGDWITMNMLDDFYYFYVLTPTNKWGQSGCKPQ
uniref:Lipase_3 domain-containing protein n=1 Tax=Steinernema glaseri TaxID=37863 RepID=A0A1I7Z1D7_9BILA